MVSDDFLDSIFSIRTLLQTATIGTLLIEARIIQNQANKIGEFEDVFEEIGELFQDMLKRDDVPIDLKHKIDCFANSQLEGGD